LSEAGKRQGQYVRVDSLPLQPGEARIVYLEGVDFPLVLEGQLFVNEDGSQVAQYLVCSDAHDVQLTSDQITTIYSRRWNVEEYHKSLKQNASLEKRPTHTVRTQTNHLFASLCGYVKLELLKLSNHLNHFALKSSIYLRSPCGPLLTLSVNFSLFALLRKVSYNTGGLHLLAFLANQKAPLLGRVPVTPKTRIAANAARAGGF
jgi:Transposase DDE domain